MLRKLVIRAFSSDTKSSSSISGLLHSFEVSLRAARHARKDSGFGRRHQLLQPAEDSSTCRAILDAMKAHESELNENAYVHALLMIGSEGQLEAARSLFQSAIKKYPLSPDLYSAMIYALARSNHHDAFEEAQALFKRALTQAGLYPTRQLYESLIEAYAGGVERSLLKPTESSIGGSNLSLPLRIYRKMLAAGHEPRISLLTTLLKLAGRLGDAQSVELVRREQERFSITLDDQYRESLLFALLQCGLVSEAEALFSEYLPTCAQKERLLNVMIHGYCRLDALTPARHLLLQQSALNGLKPGPGIACLLVECASRLGQLRDAQTWFDECVLDAGRELRWRGGTALLRAYLRANDNENFYSLLDKLRQRDPLSLPPPVWALLLTALESSPDPLRLHREIALLLEANNANSSAQEALFKMLFLAKASESLIRRLLANWQVDPSLQLWILARLGDWFGAEKLFKSLCSVSTTSVSSTSSFSCASQADWISFIMAAGEDINRVDSILEQMSKERVWITPEVRIQAMRAYLAAGHADQLRHHFNVLKSTRLPARLFAQALALQVKSVMSLQGDREAAFQLLCAHEGSWDSECLQMFLAMSRQSGQAPAELLRCLRESEVVGRLKRMGRALTGACNEVIAAGVLANDLEVVKGVLGWMRENSRFGDEQTVRLVLNASGDALKLAEEVLAAYQAAGRLPDLKLIILLVKAQLAASSTPGDQFNTKAEALSEWAVARGLSLSESFRELLLVWREYFVKHNRLDRVQHLDNIIRTL